MKTYVYIDGFNLYYGLLRDKPQFKWLDLFAFSQNVLGHQYQVAAVKYYTSRIKIRDHDRGQQERQDIYLKALKKHISPIEIHYGKFQVTEKYAQLVTPLADGTQKVQIFKTEEKGSDVNLATQMLNDAWLNAYECAVLISNDSDLEAPLKFIRKHHTNKKIGLVPPILSRQKPSQSLSDYAHFIHHIQNSHLKKSQMPNKIKNTTLYRPTVWSPDGI